MRRMPAKLIRLICVCERRMALPAKYAGQYVQCPDCHAMLLIPSAKENILLTRWTCPCGQRLKARACIAGRKVRCPKCSHEVLIPFPSDQSKFVEESFAMNDKSGVVQRVEQLSREGS
jgi:DNA-directed RNA polymerase subunit M/transcription elongation factor TFIIS